MSLGRQRAASCPCRRSSWRRARAAARRGVDDRLDLLGRARCGCPSWLDVASTTGPRPRTASRQRGAAARGPRRRPQPAFVEQLRRERADRRREAPGLRRGRCRGRAGSSCAPPRMCSSAETSTPSGCAALLRLLELLRVAEQHEARAPPATTASTLASDICPASSTKSTSTRLRELGPAQSHAVPPRTSTVPDVRAWSASSLLRASNRARSLRRRPLPLLRS